MKRSLVNYRITPSMNDGSVIIRKANKQHRCAGPHTGQQRIPCNLPILEGTIYIEYIGESQAFASGHRFHVECAETQGLVERI